MNIYEGALQFKGTWRTYQKRVLDHSMLYLKDRKIHIVAAPGSGKTTLGIELIRRIGAPCLILSPSITIRQQWLERIQTGFMTETEMPDKWFSNRISAPKPITAITYQALHSCMKQYVGVLKEEGDEAEAEEETVDFTDFNVYEVLAKAGVRTICLDEAHHLRSEWWKALEELVKNIPDVTLISLTATPPYDSTPGQWKRYIDLCGPIDEEIFTPELVKEGSLCPHQDYVYFNWPTKEEENAVTEFAANVNTCMQKLLADTEFARLVSQHRGILAPQSYSEAFLDNPRYFSSILVFLNDRSISFSPWLKELTGAKGKLPKLDAAWLETLLQGFLYDDAESYPCDTVYREQLIAMLKSYGCIHKNKVCLAKNEAISKLLISSKGKLNSIGDIVTEEYEGRKEALRMLILCDFIKKESAALIGDETRSVNEIGAVPIFEYLRRKQLSGIKLGVLSGGIVIIPCDAETRLQQLVEERGAEVSCSPLGETGYAKVKIKGSGNFIVAVITALFQSGAINTLIGTKSLLGEGWDSPCINSLILATFVGSFMLSNQMRGRAIRTMKGEPDKTSNIWHLVCMPPKSMAKNMLAGQELNEDFETLKRRFDAFLGVSYTENVIENGIERLGIDKSLNSAKDIDKINASMLTRAKDRDGLRKRWQEALKVVTDSHSIEDVSEVEQSVLEPGFFFFNAVVCLILSIMATVVMTGLYGVLAAFREPGTKVIGMLLLLFIVSFCIPRCITYAARLFRLATPQKRMKQMGKALLSTLCDAGLMEEAEHRIKVECICEAELFVYAYLRGGTTRDKTLFAACMAELFGVIDNPRYLLMQGRRPSGMNGYFAVPEALGRKKEDAELFRKNMEKAIGKYKLVYTRTPEGRKILLKARTQSFANKNEMAITGKKRLFSEYE